jgi:hypothetical protein
MLQLVSEKPVYLAFAETDCPNWTGAVYFYGDEREFKSGTSER